MYLRHSPLTIPSLDIFTNLFNPFSDSELIHVFDPLLSFGPGLEWIWIHVCSMTIDWALIWHNHLVEACVTLPYLESLGYPPRQVNIIHVGELQRLLVVKHMKHEIVFIKMQKWTVRCPNICYFLSSAVATSSKYNMAQNNRRWNMESIKVLSSTGR